MKVFRVTVLALVITVAAVAVCSGQQMEVKKFSPGEAFFIPGIGAMVVLDGEQLKVDMVLPADQRPEKFRGVDILQGDRLLMMNGAKLTSIADLRERFDAVETGEEVKFGVKREDGMHIARLVKTEQNEMAGGQMMVVQAGGDIDVDQAAASGAKVMKIDATDDGTAVLMSAGLVLKDGEKGPEVLMALPNAAEALGGNVPEAGDIVVEVQGEKVTSAKQCSEVMDKVELGSAVKMTYRHAGEDHTISFEKKESPGVMVQKKAK